MLLVLQADQVGALARVFLLYGRQVLSGGGTDDLLHGLDFGFITCVPSQLVKVRPLIVLRIGLLYKLLIGRLVRRFESVICHVF